MYADDIPQGQDPVIAIIAARINRYVARVNEEYNKDPSTFAKDITRQEAAIMNIVRAVAAALAMGEHLLIKHKLGIPQSCGDVFNIIEKAGLISTELADKLKKMLVFRNDALHQNQEIQVVDLECLILHQLRFFLSFGIIE